MPATLNFAWGFSDAAVELQPANYEPIWPLVKALQPTYWRLVIDWQLTALALKPGPFQAKGGRPVKATATGSGFVGNAHTNGAQTALATAAGDGYVTGVAPSAQNRNWTLIDTVLNDVRLKSGADIIMVIGQAMPNGWTNADYKAFCAECAVRYGPGGQGIRTDGPYAAINTGWGVRNWEVFNEENNSAYWTQTVNAAQYVGVLQAGYQGIKSVFPATPAPGVAPTGNQSCLIFGGMQHIPFSGVQFGYGYFGFDEVTFLQQCYAAAIKMGTTLGTMFDAMATHCYPQGDFAYSSGQGAISGFPSNVISGMNFPAIGTSAFPQTQTVATGSGKVNLTAPSQHGRLQCVTTITGNGVLNNYEPPGTGFPSLFMDNMRQIQGIYALMYANGDGAKKIKLTETGYGVYFSGMTADLQNAYTQALFGLLNGLPYIDCVLLYNAIDVNNSKTNDGSTGFGVIDYSNNPRPLYYWLLTLPTLAGGGSSTVTATATGVGSISSPGVLTAVATMTGAGIVTRGGGVITATIIGSGSISAARSGSLSVTVMTPSAGVLALFGGGGGLSLGGALTARAAASGIGRTGVAPHSNGDLLITSSAFGAGRIAATNTAHSTVTATATGTGIAVVPIGSEIGVVGEVTGAASTFTAGATGTGAVLSGDGGLLVVTATSVGAGTVGVVGAGTQIVTVTVTGSNHVGPVGAGSDVITATATGTGVVALFGAGSRTVTATATGGAISGTGTPVMTATTTGAGLVGAVGAGARSVSVTATGAGAVNLFQSGSLTVVATATSSITDADGGTSTVTALATGAGAVGLFGTGLALSVSAVALGTNFVPFNVTTNQSGQAVPNGAYGAWVTMVGSGGNGGSGFGTTSNGGRGGGGGGGGGALIGRSFILATNMGSTYSFTIGSGAGVDSVFSSGSVLLTAGSGGSGGGGGSGTGGSIGTGGVASVSGPGTGSVALANGGDGGLGGATSVGGDGSNTSNGAAAGGGAGGGASGSGTPTHGANGVASVGPGGNGGSGANGGGAPGASSQHVSGSNPGGTGPAGYGLVEWVAVPQNYNGGGSPVISDTATGAGTAGAVGAAAPVETVTTATAGLLGANSGAAVSITATATGAGQEGDITGGQRLVTATGTGVGVVNSTLGGLLFVTATATGAGAVGTVTGGSLSVTVTASTGAVLGRATGAAPTFTATAAGAGQEGDITGGQLLATATATGAGAVGKVTGGSLAVTAITAGIPSNFVTRDPSTGNLMYNGQRYRFGGANTPFIGLIGTAPSATPYGGTVNSDGFHYATHSEIDATLAAAQAFNANVITSWGAVQSVGTVSAVQPTLGVFNAAALEATDYCLKRCNELGIKIIANFCGNYTYDTEGSKFWYCTANGVTPDSEATQFFTNTTIINSLKAHITFCLNHVNQYTGVAYKDDPAVLAWGTGGEMSVYPLNPEWPYYAWTDAISTHIKVTCGAKQLVSDGHCAIRSDQQDGVIDVNSLTLPNVDMYQLHPYSHWTPPRYAHQEGKIAHSYGKAFFLGEFPWQGVEPDTTTSTIWSATELMSVARGSTYVDGLQMWELLAPLVTFGGGYTLHWPTPDNSSGHGLALENARGAQMAANNLAMSTGKVWPTRLVMVTTDWAQYNSAAYRGGGFNNDGITEYIPEENDIVVAFGGSQGVNTVASAPTGWVNPLGANVGVNSASHTLAVMYHIVTAAEATAGTVSYVIANMFGTAANGDGTLTVIRGVDPSNVIDAFNTAFGSASTTHVLPSLSGTSMHKDSMVLSCVSSLNNNAYTVPAGTGEAGASNGHQGMWMGLYDDYTSAGVGVSAKNITAANSDVYASISLAFRGLVGGSLAVRATAVGAGTLTSILNVTATATGAGVVGEVGGAAVSVTATATGTGLLAGSLFLIDNFTDTNGTNLTAHTPDTGGAWSVQSGSGGGCAIDTNRAYCTSTTQMINAATGVGADYEVAGQMVVLSAIHNTSWGVMGRASNSADTCYFAFLYAFSGNFSLFLAKFVNGAYTQLVGSTALPSQPTLGTTHEVKLRMVGSSISAYYDGAQLIAPITDTDITAAGFAGLVLGTATTATGVAVDKITAGPINYPDSATDSITATATGTGALGFTGGGTSTVTATATGAGVVGKTGGAAVSMTATATGAGTAAAAGTGGGAPVFTVTATGTGSIKVTARRPRVVHVFTRHRLR